jgi:NAD(P)-dependent dehydrogenase (short-subunit alcohol dehydrogenase family)
MTAEKLKDKTLVDQILSRTVIQRIADPEDLVGTAIFLSSDASSYITGQTIFVDGGLTIYGF